jgi:hypothetical protein
MIMAWTITPYCAFLLPPRSFFGIDVDTCGKNHATSTTVGQHHNLIFIIIVTLVTAIICPTLPSPRCRLGCDRLACLLGSASI